jgi:hypothetical protein
MTLKQRLTLTTAIVGLATVVGMGQANAFTTLKWEWDKFVDTNEYVNKWVWGDFYPSGLAEIEKLQVNIGDIYSEVKIKGDYANPPASEGDGTVEVDLGTVNVVADKNGVGTINVTATQSGGDVDLNPLSINNQSFSTSPGTATADFGVDVILGTIEISVPGIEPGSLDATTELAHVIGSSTAVGNIDTITSTVQTDVHTGQFNLGGLQDGDRFLQSVEGENGSYGNPFHTYAEQLAAAIAAGYVEQANIESKARAGSWWNPIDAAVSLDSLAAGNIESVNLQTVADPSLILAAERNTAEGGGWVQLIGTSGQTPTTYYPVATDQVLIADITQFSYANVTSTAKSYQDLTAFNNLGNYNGLGTPGLVAKITSSAFGNFSQISVGGPQ